MLHVLHELAELFWTHLVVAVDPLKHERQTCAGNHFGRKFLIRGRFNRTLDPADAVQPSLFVSFEQLTAEHLDHHPKQRSVVVIDGNVSEQFLIVDDNCNN